jgi:hypothetical protein
MADIGIQTAAGGVVPTPLPQTWLGKNTMPIVQPSDTAITQLTAGQARTLVAQIGYDASAWDYTKIGTNNEVGRYQIAPQELEDYGLLANGSNKQYGNACVNYRHCWSPKYINTGTATTYFYNINSLGEFLNNSTAQDHLIYQILNTTYLNAKKINVITDADSADIVAGMLYVALKIGVGTLPTSIQPMGTGAYAWRYFNVGNGNDSFNSGRYSTSPMSNNVPNNAINDKISYSVKITGITQNGNIINVISPVGTTISTATVSAAISAAVPYLSDMATATNFSLTQQISLAVPDVITPITDQGIASATDTIAKGIGINGQAIVGIDINGQAIVGGIASAIINPKAALAAIENIASTYATQKVTDFVVNTISNSLLGASGFNNYTNQNISTDFYSFAGNTINQTALTSYLANIVVSGVNWNTVTGINSF